MDQPGKVANPAPRGQLNREKNEYSPVPVRALELFDLARRVQPSRPASACSSSPYSGLAWCLLLLTTSVNKKNREEYVRASLLIIVLLILILLFMIDRGGRGAVINTMFYSLHRRIDIGTYYTVHV